MTAAEEKQHRAEECSGPSDYLAPKGEEYTKVHELLRAALEKENKTGIATFVVRGKQYLVALRAQEEVLGCMMRGRTVTAALAGRSSGCGTAMAAGRDENLLIPREWPQGASGDRRRAQPERQCVLWKRLVASRWPGGLAAAIRQCLGEGGPASPPASLLRSGGRRVNDVAEAAHRRSLSEPGRTGRVL
ncbi:Ku protein [Streptomyces sp. NPDC006314]|uniref:Ku protein n=1 Tax=Streptomyces sp. NPDC006314 TaxID=3154475 RepID=UPI0033A66E3B